MKRVELMGVMLGVVCLAVSGVEAADEAGKTVSKSVLSPKAAQPLELPAQAEKAPAAVSEVAVEGLIFMRNQEPNNKNLLYLRVQDDDGRVWLMTVESGVTALSKGNAAVGLDAISEGARVRAVFLRNGEATPMATSVAMLQ